MTPSGAGEPWAVIVSVLVAGADTVRVIAWPQHRVTRISALWDIPPGPEPAAVLDPEPMGGDAVEVAVMACLKAAGALSVHEVAQHLLLPDPSALRALRWLGARGLVRVTPEGWRSA